MKQDTSANEDGKREESDGEQPEPTPPVFRNIHGVPIEPTGDNSPAVDEPTMAPSRRTILQGMAAAGGAAMVPTAAAELGDVRPGDSGGVLSPAEGAGKADPYTKTQFRALADAMVPETPELAERIGNEHRPGGPAIGLEKFLIYSFNSFVPAFVEPGGPTNTGLNLRFAEQFALTMDAGATLLVATGRNEDSLDLQRFPLGGPFSKLSRKDRFRAINLLENQDLTIDRDMLLGDVLGLVGGLLGIEEITEGLTEALTPGLSEKTFDSLDAISDELLNSPAGTSLDGFTNGIAEALADTPTSVGDVLDNLRDQLFAGPFERDGLADKITDIPGFIKFQIMGINAFSQFGYYTEWSGYGETKINCPSNRDFNGVENVQSFAQTDYPGPARGYAALRDFPGDIQLGEPYPENEYSTDTSGGNTGGDSGGTDNSSGTNGSGESDDDGGIIGGLL